MSNPQVESRAPGAGEFLTVLEDAYLQAKRMRRSIRMDDSLAHGLGLDSLAAIEMLLVVEQHYGIELVDTDEATRTETVADLYRLVTRLIGAR
ncbi:acyl carrier protein [Micromonospora sp. KC207]|uniref:acyl carrier protein n=1 Tax=Micromonospora sp. KC207 TaxID=2530377 RepID=UPI001404882B|nr:acyl carrier protein [Micromonospora sp. KC207]